jgi:hypothetical protein
MDKGTVAAVVIVGVVLLIAAYYLTRPTGVNAGALSSGEEDTGGDRTARDVGAVFSGVGSALAGAGQAFSSVYGAVAGSAGSAGRAFAGGK